MTEISDKNTGGAGPGGSGGGGQSGVMREANYQNKPGNGHNSDIAHGSQASIIIHVKLFVFSDH